MVARLRRHAPPGIAVTLQYHVEFDAEVDAQFDIDVVLTDTRTGAAVGVVEAKYKAYEKTRSADIRQAVAYAALTDAPAAFLDSESQSVLQDASNSRGWAWRWS